MQRMFKTDMCPNLHAVSQTKYTFPVAPLQNKQSRANPKPAPATVTRLSPHSIFKPFRYQE